MLNRNEFQVFYLSETKKRPESSQLSPDIVRQKGTRLKRNPRRVGSDPGSCCRLPAYPNKGPVRPTEVTSLPEAHRRAQSTENAVASDTASVKKMSRVVE